MTRSFAAALLPVFACAGMIADSADANGRRKDETFRARLIGYNEVPAISTAARGWFRARVDEDSGVIWWTLSYGELSSAIQQAHLHFGQHHTNGGISVFLCTNLGNGPAGTPTCPPHPAEISGTIMAAEVLQTNAPGSGANQGIAAGELEELLAAVRAGAVYANVHSMMFPGGEIRGQLTR